MAVNIESLIKNMLNFSSLAVEMADEVESADLNPLICTPDKCIVADARIILKNKA